jgi:hypothetical protein
MQFVKAGILVAAFLSWNVGSSMASNCDDPRRDFAFHEEKVRENLEKELAPSVTGDIEIFVELIGLQNVAKINELKLQIRRTSEPGLNDAVSFEARGCRSIVFDPYWASGDTASFYLVLSHEAGHHFCGHTVGQVRLDRMARELEADEFSGASIRRYEIYHSRGFFNQVYSAAIAKYPEQGDATHPPRALRLAAIKRGYEHGSHCGGLASVTGPGYSPPQRSWGTAKPCRPVQTGPTSWACAD